jgi:hypothetical protein
MSTDEPEQFDLETVGNRLSLAAKLLANLKSDLLDKLKANLLPLEVLPLSTVLVRTWL